MIHPMFYNVSRKQEKHKPTRHMKGDCIMEYVQPIRDLAKIEAMKNALAKSGTRNLLLFCMGINTGLRISDILTMKVSDVNGKDFYTLTEKKTSKKRRVNLHAVKSMISAYCVGMNDDDYLFASRKGGEPITRIQAYRILNNAASQCGLDEIGTHTMRKTFGYHHYQKYHDVAILQELFNHSAPSITLRYIGITQDEIDAATEDFSL